MKGFLCMYLQIFLLARRHKLPLKRDLILAAIADEEAGFAHGSRFLVDHHRELIDAEFALNEGGAVTFHVGKMRLYAIQVAEKGVCWMRMRAYGRPGHGSVPHKENAIFFLAKALHRLNRAGGLPVHLTPTVKAMLASLSKGVPFPYKAIFYLLQNRNIADLLFRALPGDTSSVFNAMFRNTVSPTVLKAGSKTNVIPSEAEVHLDCRLLPGQSFASVKQEILAITGDKVELEPLMTTEGAEFPTDTPLYRILVEAVHQMDAQGIVFPMLTPGATDACEYRRAGITVYGFTPGNFPPEIPVLRMAHAHDERIPIQAIRSGLPAIWHVVNAFCT